MHSHTKQSRSHSVRSSFPNRSSNTNPQRKRRSTWTCHPKRYSSLSVNRLIRWRSHCYRKRVTSQTSLLSPQEDSIPLHQQLLRHTMITISTLSSSAGTHTRCSRLLTATNGGFHSERKTGCIFHTQSLLFLFGFLFFPCWWVGGYYIKAERISDEEASLKGKITVHPSLLANGKTASRLLLELPVTKTPNDSDVAFVLLFYKWNRRMCLFSIVLVVMIISLLIWYFVQYY